MSCKHNFRSFVHFKNWADSDPLASKDCSTVIFLCFPTNLRKCLARRLYISISEGKGTFLDFVECFILSNSSNLGEFPKSYPKALQTVDLNSQLVTVSGASMAISTEPPPSGSSVP